MRFLHITCALISITLAGCGDAAPVEAPGTDSGLGSTNGVDPSAASSTTSASETSGGMVATSAGLEASATTGAVAVGAGGVAASGVGGMPATTSESIGTGVGGNPAGVGKSSTATSGAEGTVGGFAGSGGTGSISEYELDCGPEGVAIESAGPPENRVNYIIVGDGYTEDQVDTTFIEHVNSVMDRRFNHESGEPFGRYRKFVNICAFKAVSQGGIGNNSAFGGSISGRVASIDNRAVNDYLDANLPMDMEADWRAAVFNIDTWNNVGGGIMIWAGGHAEAAGAALHEGGHSHHQLADEYGTCTGGGCGTDTMGSGSSGTEYGEINMTGDPQNTAGKWDRWMGVVQKGLKAPDLGATGIQSTFSGGRYESPESGQYRPSDNSMMNSLFGDDLDTSFNCISREQIIYTIWAEVTPIDATEPPEGPVSGAVALQVMVVDPAVINVDWYVDGALVAANGGTRFDLAASGLSAGTYTVEATAYDNATEELVRYRDGECPSGVTGRYCHSPAWLNSTETASWTVTLP